MSRTEEILNLTQQLHHSTDDHDIQRASQVVNEILAHMDDHSVEDAAYYDAVEQLEEVSSFLEEEVDELTSEQWVQVGTVATQVDELYLRHHRNKSQSQMSEDEIQAECELFREKAIRYAQDSNDAVEQIENVIEKLEEQSELLNIYKSKFEQEKERQKERIDQMATDLVGDSEIDVISDLEQAKEKIENDERREAKEILRNLRQRVEDDKHSIGPYSASALSTRIGMAESDVKLGRTIILENLISEMEQ